MFIPTDDTPAQTEREKVEDWRELELMSAGYPPEVEIVFAQRPDIDLHQACRLLADGCTVELAMEILS